jgi:alpha-L-rhamnosidase
MANAFPLYLGLVPNDRKNQVLENLIYNIAETNDTHLTTGVLGTKYLIDALSMYGRSDVAWALATQTTYPSWAEMMKRFNTMCEFWTLKQSHNHVMMGSIDAWFYNSLAGIQLSEETPAYKHFIVKPFFAPGLDSISASVNTLRGEVSSKWRKTNTGYTMEVSVPFNCSATVFIPKKGITEVSESGESLEDSENVKVIETDGGYNIVSVPSGLYRFIVGKESPE